MRANYANEIIKQFETQSTAEIDLPETAITVTGNIVNDDIVEIERIRLLRDYRNIHDLGSLSQKIIDRLNNESNPVGKGWKEYERLGQQVKIVSGIFPKRGDYYGSHQVEVNESGIIFTTYRHKYEGRPWKEESKATILVEHLDGFIESLVEGSDI